MSMTMHCDIVSAEGSLYSGAVEAVFVPAEAGELGIFPRHAPLLTRLKPGEVRVQTAHEVQSFFVSGGILEVQSFTITVLSDTAERATDIDEAAALEAKQRAEDQLQRKEAELDLARAQAELAEAVARLRVLDRLRKRTR